MKLLRKAPEQASPGCALSRSLRCSAAVRRCKKKTSEVPRHPPAIGGSPMRRRVVAGAIAEQARRVGMPFVNQRWLGGMLTNFATVYKRLQRLKELEEIDFDLQKRGFSLHTEMTTSSNTPPRAGHKPPSFGIRHLLFVVVLAVILFLLGQSMVRHRFFQGGREHRNRSIGQ